MDHDSEVETILADDDWFNTPGEGAERRGGALGRRREIPNEESHINYNSSPFDEEELFSSSGSLSSLHEFSDSDDENDNNRMESSTNGATIRNSAGRSKSSNSVNNSNGSRLVVMSPAANTESEVDVDGDDLRGTTTPLYSSKKKPSIHEGSPSSLWQIHRRRKVIADDEDDNDSNSDNPNNLDADVEDSPSNKNNHKRQKVAQMLRRNLSPSSKSTNCAVDQSSREQESEHRDFVRKNQVDAALRRHRLTKRRKPRYDDPDYTDDSGCPQLVYFAAKDDCSVCRKLLLRGAAIDKADLHGLTAVHAASKHANLETLRLLLNPPARSHFHDDTETEDGSTILEDPESQFLRQLMSPFPNINSTTLHSHLTPLHQAVMSDNIDAVCLLLDNGANTSITNSRNLTPLEICSNEDIARLLTDRAKIQRAALVRDKAGQTKLHRACSAGDLGQTIKFICQGADINMKDNAGWTSLHEAALEGHNDVVVELLRRGADFAARGFGGDTPLHDACANGHVDVVRSLLAAGADIHIKNNKNITPEDMAEEGEQDEVIQIIEQHKRVKGKERIGPSVAREASKHLSKGKSKGKHPAVYPSASDNRALDISNDKANNTVEIEFDVVSNPSVPDQESSSKPNANGKHSGRQSPAFSKIQKVWRSESAQHRHSVEREIVNSDTTTSASQRRELMSLKRLCDEAEKPQVNYYFSSNSSKLSRDERKLQVLVGTIERMEKRKSKPQRRASLGSEANDTLSNEALDNFSIAGDMQTDRENTNENEKFADNTAYPHDTSSTSLSPKRRRGRPPKKRVINDDDDDDKDDGGLIVPGKTACHSPKRTKHISELLTAAESIVKTEHIQNGLEQERMQKQQQKRQRQPSRSSVITIDGSNKPSNNNKNPVRPSSLFDAATTVTPTVEIKSEPIFGQTVEHQPPQNVHKSRTAKPPRIEEGRTIVEDSAAQIQRAEALTQSSIAAQAIRYLPLYTIQLRSDPPTSKLDYFVVDLQIRLLLGLPVETPRDSTSDDEALPVESNPLFAKYPYLCRQKITESQKERLWEPLAGMFVSNMQFIHETATSTLARSINGESELATPSMDKPVKTNLQIKSSASAKALNTESNALNADSKLVSQFTLYERKRFVELCLYFVKLDEVVRIIRRDFPQISKQLITITLDLSSIGLADGAAVGIHSPTAHSRPITNVADKDDSKNIAPVWNGPQKMLPLRYALKLHYKNRMDRLKTELDSSDRQQ